MNSDLIVAIESIHEGENVMAYTCIDNLVDEWSGIVIFGESSIEISKICTNMYGALFFGD